MTQGARYFLLHFSDLRKNIGCKHFKAERRKYKPKLFMDSLGSHDPEEVAANLRGWLKHEWIAKRSKSSRLEPLVVESFFGGGRQGLALLRPRVPKQDNYTDCGVFALEFAEAVVQRSPDISLQDLSEHTVAGFDDDMFAVADMDAKRRNTKELVGALIDAHELTR